MVVILWNSPILELYGRLCGYKNAQIYYEAIRKYKHKLQNKDTHHYNHYQENMAKLHKNQYQKTLLNHSMKRTKKIIEQIIDSFLFYGHVVDSLILHAIIPLRTIKTT